MSQFDIEAEKRLAQANGYWRLVEPWAQEVEALSAGRDIMRQIVREEVDRVIAGIDYVALASAILDAPIRKAREVQP